jgi:uridine kinase
MKPTFKTANVINRVIRTFKKKQKETGKAVDDILAEFIYGEIDSLKASERIAAMRIYYDLVIPKQTETSVTVNKPTTRLPEMKEDPAKVIQMNRG